MNSPSIKIISLNIERSKHIDRILPFLVREQPDVFCVQELCKKDIQYFQSELLPECAYIPMAFIADDDETSEPCEAGLGIFSRLKITASRALQYAGEGDKIPVYYHPDQSTTNRHLLISDLIKDGVLFKIGTTHFTWTPDGTVDDTQRQDLSKLLEMLKNEDELILTGDFNAPRGGEIFSTITNHYGDNVPLQYTTSSDGALHRAGKLEHMVDGLFSTPMYEVKDVRMECGVSDHCALIGTVSKRR